MVPTTASSVVANGSVTNVGRRTCVCIGPLSMRSLAARPASHARSFSGSALEVDPRTTRCDGSSACTPRAITVLHVPLRPKSATPPMRGSTAASRSAAFAGSWFTTREKGNAGRSERTPSGSSSPPSGSDGPRVVAATSGERRRGTRDRVERYARDNRGRVASIIAAGGACVFQYKRVYERVSNTLHLKGVCLLEVVDHRG